MKRNWGHLSVLIACLAVSGCVAESTNQVNRNATPSPLPSPTVSPSPVENRGSTQPLTLPVLDAFFADDSFSGKLKTRLQLSDEQVSKLKELAHSETAQLNEENAGREEQESATARTTATEEISALIGAEKTQQLAELVGELWSGPTDEAGDKSVPASNREQAGDSNPVPADSRIVVNIPAYRMDAFDDGRLIKSYKIGIGYPEFPLPIGPRKARVIIFNPTWTPPDEPWVARMKNVSAGQKIAAGSKLNPLGPIKIPIGGPSLIHGGKSPAKLGTFASHGCVGLTTPQIESFARVLAQLGDVKLTDEELTDYGRNKTETKQVKLDHAVPVELRYQTIVVEDGKLHIYRDVYDQETNTEENLRAVLAANGVRFDDLAEGERTEALSALAQMSGQPAGSAPKASPSRSTSPTSIPPPEKRTGANRKTTAAAKNKNEIVIEIAGLQGKGYPSPVALDTGSGK